MKGGVDNAAAFTTMTTIMITASVKLTEEQMGQLRRNAREKHMSISEYLRAAIFPPRKTGKTKILLKRHPVSGLYYNAAPPPRIPTQAELDEALKDYL